MFALRLSAGVASSDRVSDRRSPGGRCRLKEVSGFDSLAVRRMLALRASEPVAEADVVSRPGGNEGA